MTRLKRPLDRKAVLIANDAIRSETGGRPLTMEPKDAVLRKKWREAYIKAAGKNAQIETSARKKVDSPIQECPDKLIIKWIKVRLSRKKRNVEYAWWAHSHFHGYAANNEICELAICFRQFHRPDL